MGAASNVGWAGFFAHADSGNIKFVMKMILPTMSITYISTQLNTGMYNVRLIGLIRHFIAMCVMGYMRMAGLLRWKMCCWDLIDADCVGTKACPPYLLAKSIVLFRAQVL